MSRGAHEADTVLVHAGRALKQAPTSCPRGARAIEAAVAALRRRARVTIASASTSDHAVTRTGIWPKVLWTPRSRGARSRRATEILTHGVEGGLPLLEQ